MKKAYAFVAIGVGVLFLAIFWLSAANRCPDLPQAQKERLVAEAKAIFATAKVESLAKRPVAIDPAPYPHLSSLAPKNVTLRSDGLYIRMKAGFVTECGYFIPSAITDEAGLDTSGDPAYQKTGEQFYIYRIKG